MTYDVIVVGARCAGAPLGMLLARAGHKVLVVDRAHFPSDTMSTHFIQSPGMLRLARWGLHDRLMATGCPPVTKAVLEADGEPLEIELPQRRGIQGLASPRRTVLDKLLVDAAREAGAEVREGLTFTTPLLEGERVVGIEGYTDEGPFRAEARFTVGADGRNSAFAEAVGAGYRFREPEQGAGYYSYFAGVGLKDTYLKVSDDRFCVAFPTHDDLTVVALGWIGADTREIRRDVEGNFSRALATLGEFGQRVLAGKREERFVGLADLVNFLRKAWGPGWALAGDALYFKDPIPADGITDAFRAADLLASALDDALTGRSSEEEALQRYEDNNDELALPMFRPTVKIGATESTAQERLDAFIELRMLTEQESDRLEAAEEVSA